MIEPPALTRMIRNRHTAGIRTSYGDGVVLRAYRVSPTRYCPPVSTPPERAENLAARLLVQHFPSPRPPVETWQTLREIGRLLRSLSWSPRLATVMAVPENVSRQREHPVPPQSPRRLLTRRLAPSCLRCRRQKIKCAGTRPCDQCTKRGLTCYFDDAAQKVIVTRG
jgi:hypothetical protein